jgi:hypothetical protein
MIEQHDTNNYWEQLERLEKLIRASELKAGILFSFHSLILGLFVDKIQNFEELLKGNILFVILVVLWSIAVFISIFYCFKCFQPNMKLKYRRNVFFFRDAARNFKDVDSYVKEITKICQTNEEIVKRLSEQIHAESVIIDKKFYNVKLAIQFFLISFIFIVLMVVSWLFVEFI